MGGGGFSSAAGGLVSTVDDYLAFGQMMLNGGTYGRERILARPTIAAMTTNQLTPAQRTGTEPFLGRDVGLSGDRRLRRGEP